MSKFTVRCSDAVALARSKFSCVHVSNLGAAHMILSAFYRVWHERLCVARWQVADLLRQERESDGPSLVWYVCLSPRHARAHRGHDIIAAIDSIGNYVAELSGRQVPTSMPRSHG